GDAKRFEQFFQLEKYLVLAPSKDIRSHGPTGVINRMPEPPWLRFLAHVTPHLIELGRQTSALRQLVSATQFNLSLRWGQRRQHRLIDLLPTLSRCKTRKNLLLSPACINRRLARIQGRGSDAIGPCGTRRSL